MQEAAYSFGEVSSAPAKPGLYAWYHRPEISHADIKKFIATIAGCDDEQLRVSAVRQFLDKHLFGPLRESDYKVSISGQLKPRYGGRIPHLPSISGSLVARLAAEPSRLWNLDRILRASTPYFASPIYIGVARRSLRKRLSTHHELICRFREAHTLDAPRPEITPEATERQLDHSFAWDVVHGRRLSPLQLVVHVLPINVDADAALDGENVLNRINHPLCGRL